MAQHHENQRATAALLWCDGSDGGLTRQRITNAGFAQKAQPAPAQHPARQGHGRQEIALHRMAIRADCRLRRRIIKQHRKPMCRCRGAAVQINSRTIRQRRHAAHQGGGHFILDAALAAHPGL